MANPFSLLTPLLLKSILTTIFNESNILYVNLKSGDFTMKKTFIIVLLGLVLCLFATACANTAQPQATELPKATEEQKTAEPVKPTNAPTEVPTQKPTPEPTAVPTEKPKMSNVVAGKKVTTDYNESGQFADPQLMVDEDELTRWSGFDLGRKDPKTNLRHTVVIDLEGEFTIYEFEIYFESLTGYYEIDVSDTGADDSWKKVYEYDDFTTQHMPIEDEGTFPADTKAKFVRILIDYPEGEDYTDNDWPYCSIFEFVCYGAAA